MGPETHSLQFNNLFTELMGLTAEFRRRGLDYAVCGGLALAVYGFPRATKDIDVLVLEQSLPEIKAAARHCGFTIPGTVMTFRSGDRLVRLIKPLPPSEDYLMLDLMLVGELNRDAWETRADIETTAGKISVAGVEGLKSMKRRAGRPHDLADIQRLEEIEHGRADG
jgi:hypothetical protein